MQLGIHVVERSRLPVLAAAGVDVPEPWTGVLDVLRAVSGHLPEPTEGRALGLVGLDALLAAVPGDGATVLRAVRGGLVEARRYFSWKQIPVVLLVEGKIDDPADGTGLGLTHGGRRWSLAPLLGVRLTPARPDAAGWWWTSQIG
jgi:hypothetical protein